MQSINIKHLIFDMDGVILDSTSASEKFWLSQAKMRLPEDSLLLEQIDQQMHGRPIKEIVGKLFNTLQAAEQAELLRQANKFDNNMQPACIISAEFFITELFGLTKGLKLVTSASTERLKLLLERRRLYNMFSHIISSDDVEKGKPDPEPYETMANKLGAKVEDCLVFEDSISGVKAAKEAGMKVIGVNPSAKMHVELKKLGAITVIDNFKLVEICNYRKIQIDTQTLLELPKY